MKGLLFAFLWYSSILWSVYFLYCPLVPLLFINRAWFRRWMDIILACWEMYPTVLLELLMGCRVYVSGDSIRAGEGAVLLMNHRNRLDWFFLWAALVHASKPPAHRAKFVLKSDVRLIPGIGWGLQLAGFLFIHRNWTKDRNLILESLNYFKDLRNKYQILIFAEGTDLSPATKERSNAFARKNGLPLYNYVLHPRTTGFSFIANHMRLNEQLDAVYNMTIAYPKTLPETEKDILAGKIPQEVHFKIERHDVSTLPRDEYGLKEWCEQRWNDKESLLRQFYSAKDTRKFSPDSVCDLPWNIMYFVFAFWTAFVIFAKIVFFTSTIAFYWVIFWTSFFVVISQLTDGVQRLEIWLHNRGRKP